jgi:hypothetical protein
MSKKRLAGGRPEMLSRNIEISSFSATVRLHAVHPKGEDPYIESEPWLELRGTVTEPVRDVRDVRISMYPQDTLQVGTARPAAVGALIQARPQLSFVLKWSHVDFDRVWALAVGGRLTHAHLYFTKPHYNTGLVVNASFSNEEEE